MTHSPLLSIIIPLFNKVDSVKRCIASILEQDYQNYELIIIDDGSTDGSADLVKEAFSDARIKLIHTINGGVSSARNKGIERSGGRYVMFIDADDYIAPDAIPELLAKTQGSDLIMMGAERISRSGKKSYLSAVDSKERDYKSRFICYGMGP